MSKRWVILALGAIVLAGCGPSAEKQSAEKAPAPDAATRYRTEVSTKDLMKYAMDPAADIVWAASGYVVDEKGTTDLSPKTDAGWVNTENHAAMVAELANTLMLPGRSPEEPKWNGFANKLYDSAMAAKKAAHNHDKAGLLRTGSDMFLVCTACHKYYVLGEKD